MDNEREEGAQAQPEEEFGYAQWDPDQQSEDFERESNDEDERQEEDPDATEDPDEDAEESEDEDSEDESEDGDEEEKSEDKADDEDDVSVELQSTKLQLKRLQRRVAMSDSIRSAHDKLSGKYSKAVEHIRKLEEQLEAEDEEMLDGSRKSRIKKFDPDKDSPDHAASEDMGLAQKDALAEFERLVPESSQHVEEFDKALKPFQRRLQRAVQTGNTEFYKQELMDVLNEAYSVVEENLEKKKSSEKNKERLKAANRKSKRLGKPSGVGASSSTKKARAKKANDPDELARRFKKEGRPGW